MSATITILGTGSMGTACGLLLCENPEHAVTLWSPRSESASKLNAERENTRLLPGFPLPDCLKITGAIDEIPETTDLLVIATPTKFLRETLNRLAGRVPKVPVVSVVKGLENTTLMRPCEIVTDVLGTKQVVSLCGPSHAEEIARRLPTSVVAASRDLALARRVQQTFSTDRFRVYTNYDLVGTELAGALKNVIAIAAGLCDGLGFGDNAKAALLTRGVVEITRFGEALGAESRTFSGLSGIGDLMTTCFSSHGRNRHVGERLGRGETLDQIMASMAAVAEGVNTTRSVYEYASENGIDMPITGEVYRVLFEGKPPGEVTDSLMNRPPRRE